MKAIVVLAQGLPTPRLMAIISQLKGAGAQGDVESWDPKTGTVKLVFEGEVEAARLMEVTGVTSVAMEPGEPEAKDGDGDDGAVRTLVTKLV